MAEQGVISSELEAGAVRINDRLDDRTSAVLPIASFGIAHFLRRDVPGATVRVG